MTTIGTNDMANFFISNVHSAGITLDDAKDLGIEISKEDFEDLDKDNDGKLTSYEIKVDNDLFEDFATMVQEAEKSAVQDVDPEKEKEKQTAVKNKTGAGVK